MSNRAVSATYRSVIDDVISNVRQDFEDMGIEREVLEELQRSWEAKIVATGVADFDGAAPAAPASKRGGKAKADGSSVKDEKASETKAEEGQSSKLARGNGSIDVAGGTKREGTAKDEDEKSLAENGGGIAPFADSAASTSDGGKKRKRPASDDDEIGSDLDDSDEDDIEGNDGDGNEDMILCLYDKVQRVRNKWKCVLKDGVASIDGRDYVFSKLASEMEW